jgi:hypothetical protein
MFVGIAAAEGPTGLDQSTHVVTALGGVGDVVSGESAGRVAGGFGALGGVLGEVKVSCAPGAGIRGGR